MPQESHTLRQQMVDDQLRPRGIKMPRVLTAFSKVPRERFVPHLSLKEAYADRAWPIDCDQSISQPVIVATMTEAMQLDGTEHVLEVGTGSGYQAAVLAELANTVVSVERHPQLSTRAGEVLQDLGYHKVELIVGDGTLGWPPRAPFDRVLVTAAAATYPPPLWQQLTEGGTLVMPVGTAEHQVLYVYRKVAGAAETHPLSGCRFVPLLGKHGRFD